LDSYTRYLLEVSFYYIANDNCDKKVQNLTKVHPFERAKTLIQATNKCGIVQNKKVGETNEVELFICPCSIYDKNIYSYIQMYNSYKKGTMPHTGGFLEQSAILIELINSLDSIIEEYKEAERKKEEQKMKHKKR